MKFGVSVLWQLTASQLQASRRTWLNRSSERGRQRRRCSIVSSEVTAAESGNQQNLGCWPPVCLCFLSSAQSRGPEKEPEPGGSSGPGAWTEGGWTICHPPNVDHTEMWISSASVTTHWYYRSSQFGRGRVLPLQGWNLGQTTEYIKKQLSNRQNTWLFIIDYSIIFYNMYLLLYNI